MHLYLIRHAESENNARPEYERVEDPAITPRGIEQAEYLGRWLRTLSPQVLVSSPFRRALQTTFPASVDFVGSLEVWSDIFERGGCYRGWNDENSEGAEGMRLDEILGILPNANTELQCRESGWWRGRPPEKDDETRVRAASVRAKIEQRLDAPGTKLVVVTHAEFQRMLLGELLQHSGIDVGHLGPICNAGITYLQREANRWKLHWFNAVTHLPPTLITGAKG